ncbi:MAG: hypothetical protein L6Q57_07945, partial [Alphaproteobacteria bacterium]|nr:hypothetical protein [Alphaproteobacteria bacterium]
MIAQRSLAAPLPPSDLDQERDRVAALVQRDPFSIAVIFKLVPWMRDLILSNLARNGMIGSLIATMYSDPERERMRLKAEEAWREWLKLYLSLLAQTALDVWTVRQSVEIVGKALDRHIAVVERTIKVIENSSDLLPKQKKNDVSAHKETLKDLREQRDSLTKIEEESLPEWEKTLSTNPPPASPQALTKIRQDVEETVTSTAQRVPVLGYAWKALRAGAQGLEHAIGGVHRYFSEKAKERQEKTVTQRYPDPSWSYSMPFISPPVSHEIPVPLARDVQQQVSYRLIS